MTSKVSLASDFSDAKLAERVAAEVFRGRYLYAPGLGWWRWDGRRWAASTDIEATEAVRLWAVAEFEASAKLARTGQLDKEAVKRTLALLNKAKLNGLVQLARGIDGVLVPAERFDAWPHLLNCLNCVVDLTDGSRHPHDPALLLTHLAAAEYHPGAQHPDWQTAINAVPAEVRAWLQLRYGQAATGYTPPDDLMIVQQGGGENGKTTFSGAVAAALGDYYQLVPDRVILGNPSDHPTELMTLRGARLALIEETPEARRLAVSRLKKVVGTPEVTARLIRQDSVTFAATHTLFLSTNYLPTIEEVDHGTWRRLALVRFPYRFGTPEAGREDILPVDRHLRQRLKTDPAALAAVLSWIVDGAVAWFRAGQIAELPSRVVDDTRAWRAESDQVLAYLDERIVFDPQTHITGRDLHADLNDWLRARGQREWSEKLLVNRFAEHGEVTRHGVIKSRVRAQGGRSSRPATVVPVPTAALAESGFYTAWFGMRFRTAADALSTDVAALTAGRT